MAALVPWPLHEATAWPPAARTATRQSAGALTPTSRTVVSSTPSPLGLMSGALAPSVATTAAPTRFATLARTDGRSP